MALKNHNRLDNKSNLKKQATAVWSQGGMKRAPKSSFWNRTVKLAKKVRRSAASNEGGEGSPDRGETENLMEHKDQRACTLAR